MKLSLHSVVAATVASLLTAVAPAAQADTFRVTFSSAHGPQLPWIAMVKTYFIPEVDKRLKEAGGKHNIVWTEAFSGTLAKVGGELETVEKGVAEMGFVYTIFEQAKVPLQAVTFMAPFGSDDARVMNKIMYELNTEMPELAREWTRHNQIFLAALSTDTDYILSASPINTVADLKGRKIGAAGSLSLWANGIGAVPVQGDFATHYNNLKTGVYDSVIAFTTGMYPAKLHQVAPHATRIDLGSMMIGAITINKTFHDKLPPEVQKVIKDVGKDYNARIAETLHNLAGNFEKKMVEEGAKFSRLPAEERRKWATTMPAIGKNWVDANAKRGVPAQQVLTAYMKKLRDNNVQLVRDWDKN